MRPAASVRANSARRSIRSAAAPAPQINGGSASALAFMHFRRAAFHLCAPFIDRFDIKAPIAADPECGDFAPFNQPIDSGRMHVQVFRHLLDGHYLTLPPE